MTAGSETTDTRPPPPPPCRRCKEHEATLTIRAEHVCRDCYCRFVTTKTVKRLEVLARETARNQLLLQSPLSHPPSITSASASNPATLPASSAPDHRRRRPPRTAASYLLGLSLGASSAALVHVADEICAAQAAKGRDAAFGLAVVYVDVDLSPRPSLGVGTGAGAGTAAGGGGDASYAKTVSQKLLDRWSARYPRFRFERVPLASAALRLRGVDWAALRLSPPPLAGGSSGSGSGSNQPTEEDDKARLRHMLASLPSPTSRADVLRLLVRHVLLARAAEGGYDALWLGSSTTALAEVALAETAKGRGFALPWLVSDGDVEVEVGVPPGGGGRDRDVGQGQGQGQEGVSTTVTAAEQDGSPSTTTMTKMVTLYYPLRDLLRAELVAYNALTTPPVGELLLSPTDEGHSSNDARRAVVSHRDLSIDDVVGRYFSEVEAGFPAVVANVVRTTAKLERRGGGEDGGRDEGGGRSSRCGLCGMPLDEQGDERWRGEVGVEEGEVTVGEEGGGDGHDGGTAKMRQKSKLCYGCQRSVRC